MKIVLLSSKAWGSKMARYMHLVVPSHHICDLFSRWNLWKEDKALIEDEGGGGGGQAGAGGRGGVGGAEQPPRGGSLPEIIRVAKVANQGKICILDIDMQGVKQIKQSGLRSSRVA